MTEPHTKKRTCNETRVVQTHRIFPSDLNNHETLFGGKLMSFIDNTASISVSRFSRSNAIVTASMDELHFIHPIKNGHSVCVETYITGAGKTSIEVFAKVLGEDLVTGERYIGATSFLTFVVLDRKKNPNFALPNIVAESTEEKMICEGYQERRQKRLKDKEGNKELVNALSLLPPWISSPTS